MTFIFKMDSVINLWSPSIVFWNMSEMKSDKQMLRFFMLDYLKPRGQLLLAVHAWLRHARIKLCLLRWLLAHQIRAPDTFVQFLTYARGFTHTTLFNLHHHPVKQAVLFPFYQMIKVAQRDQWSVSDHKSIQHMGSWMKTWIYSAVPIG